MNIEALQTVFFVALLSFLLYVLGAMYVNKEAKLGLFFSRLFIFLALIMFALMCGILIFFKQLLQL